MLNEFILIAYTLFLLLLLFLFSYKNNKFLTNSDFFRPTTFFLIFTAFEIPFAFSLINDHELIPYYALIHIKDFDAVFLQHFAIAFLFVGTVLLTLMSFNPKIGFIGKLFDVNVSSIKIYLMLHIILLIITMISFVVFLNTIGGLIYLLLNIDSKSAIIQGTGYLQAIFNTAGFLNIGFLIMYFSHKENISIKNKLYLVFIILFIFLLLSSIGSRKVPMLLILYSILMWNYNVKKVQFFTIQNIVLVFVGLLYFAAVPLFRTVGATEHYMDNIPQLIDDSVANIGIFFQRFSELERSLMIYSLFDSSNLWLGKSFIDILYAPLPRGLFPDKPPVDEGVYLYNIAHGNLVEPSTPLTKMMAVGWPPSTITNMYINFWYPGVVVGGIFYGYFLKYFYNLAKELKFNAISVFLYSSVIFGNFALTNRNIVGFLTMMLFAILLVKITSIIVRIRM